MKGFINLFNQFWDKRSRDIIIGSLALIESFDKKLMRADLQPLLEYTVKGETAGTKFAILSDIPVQFLFSGGFYIRPCYAKGDLVWVTYATFDMDKGLTGGFNSAGGSLFSRENASVSHGIAMDKWKAPAEFDNDGLLIGHSGSGMYMHFQNNKIVIKGDIEVTGSITATADIKAAGKLEAGGDLTVKGKADVTGEVKGGEVKAGEVTLINHTHLCAAPGYPSGKPAG